LNTQALASDAEAQAYIAFLQSTGEQGSGRSSGLVNLCQMNVSRQVDGGPYAATVATC
jgi:hypothetical protein